MSKNIKEIGKELLGKSLNSFHRKTGLTQLEKNNEMQDGILDGILSQVDDAYIEKTEQSNVIHLDGSGDGVVVVDSIEGNTMVNLHPTDLKINSGDNQDSSTTWHVGVNMDKTRIKPNTYYTVFVLNSSSKVNRCYFNLCRNTVLGLNENNSSLFYTDDYEQNIAYIHFYSTEPVPKSEVVNTKVVVLEGDYTNCSINYFEGLQSSFEEKVNSEGKYEIEILSNNKNLVFEPLVNGDIYNENGQMIIHNGGIWRTNYIKVKPNTTYIVSYDITPNWRAIFFYDKNKKFISNFDKSSTFTTPTNCYYIGFKAPFNTGNVKLQIEKGTQITSYTPHKSNKIKLLINEPLRGIGNIKDRLCIKDNKLMVKRFYKEVILNGTENWSTWSSQNNETTLAFYCQRDIQQLANLSGIMCDNFIVQDIAGKTIDCIDAVRTHYLPRLRISKSKLNTQDINGLKQWLQNNPTKLVFQTIEPIYEEVTNEYGEPILLEGYENGTVYIDSTIVSTTTVRYTPKMESFKTLKEVNKNNNSITLDINENIIPYMMDVDYMIMEKELCLLNTKNIRKMEELDMTSMQKRTQDMLERLIKGKTLTEQECKTRVTTYLNAGKITDEQAEELMLLISEIYN